VIVFLACFVFWLALSGHGDLVHVALGAAAAALVSALNAGERALATMVRRLPWLVAYAGWLLVEIVRSNIQVARLVLDPRLPVAPVVVRVPAPAADDLVVTTYANSITLTPGTVTLDVEDGTVLVHALTPASAAAVASGVMAGRVARVFGARRA
jgi:multicomponent Na+:H+ antiporter subunit E